MWSLGKHKIGDFHWYMAFDSISPFFLENELRDGKKFDTHQDLLKLIVTIHESYHVMQNILLGTCIWYQHSQDKFAVEMAKSCQQDPSKTLEFPLPHEIFTDKSLLESKIWGDIKYHVNEIDLIENAIYSSRVTDGILEEEIRVNPSLSSSFEKSFGLSGVDLLETHAAIATERKLARLRMEFPNSFNNNLLNDLEECFKVDKMSQCCKVISLFNEKVVKYFPFEKANESHQLSPYCQKAAEHGLLLFLLDFALQTYPLNTKINTLSIFEDIIPTTRFLKLVSSVYPCVQSNNGADFNLHEHYLYQEFAEDLVLFSNRCNTEAQSKNESFLQLCAILELWKKRLNTFDTMVIYGNVKLKEVFHTFNQYWSEGLSFVKDRPALFFELDLFDISQVINFLPFYSTAESVQVSGVGSMILEKTASDGRTIYNIAVSPITLTEIFLTKKIMKEFSDSLYNKDFFVCPIAETYDFYPCEYRSDKCKKILNLRSFPRCFVWQIIIDFYM